MEALARHVTGVLARQEEKAGGYLVRFTRPAHWLVATKFSHLLFIKRGSDQRGPDRSWSHRVHPDFAVVQIQRQASSESHDSPFRSGVINQLRASPVSGNRRRIHYGTPLFQVRHGILRHPEIGEKIGVERTL